MSGVMLGQPGRQQFTTTSAILGKGGRPVRVYGWYLLSGGTASVVALKDGQGAGNTTQVQIDGVISKFTNFSDPQGLLFPNGCFVVPDANTVNLTISFVEETL